MKTNYFNQPNDYNNYINIFGKYRYRATNKMVELSNKVFDLIKYISKTELNTIELEAIQSSGIEGYYSTQAELHDASNTSEGVSKVRANIKALEIVKNACYKELTVNELFILSGLFQGKYIDNYRDEDVCVCVVDSNTGESVHNGCKPDFIHDNMASLINYYNNDSSVIDLHAKLWKSIIIHYIFVEIHPFTDGNGRLARTLQYKYLITNVSDKFKRFSVSYCGKDLLPKYYKSLQKVEDLNYDITPFLETELELIIASMRSVIVLDTIADMTVTVNKFKHVLTNDRYLIPERDRNILISMLTKLPKLLVKSPNKDCRVSIKKLSNILSTDSYTIDRLFTEHFSLFETANIIRNGDYIELKL